MKWLLLIMVLDVSDGGIRMVHQETKVFASEAACNLAGDRLTKTVEYPGDDLRSLSICIPETAYEV